MRTRDAVPDADHGFTVSKLGTAYIDVQPDLKGFSREIDRRMGALGKKASGDFSKGFSKVGTGAFAGITKGAAVAGLAIGAGLVVEAKKAVAAYTETEKVGKQTNAVLKSTGGIAGVTAKHISDLATSISRKTGIDDEQIQSSENLLATFTNVRNEAGRGNKIFDRSTQAITDMSVALGQDTKSSAIQLGKALNDPIKGVTALQRVGVSFTAKQKDQIKTLVQSGKTLDAQKLILREVNKEFGGSAAAQAQPLDKLKVAVGNIQEAIGSGLKPAVDNVATSLEGFAIKALPDVQKVADAVSKTFARKDLDLGEKITVSTAKVRKAAAPLITELGNELQGAHLGPKLSKAFQTAAPALVDAAAASAPRAAGAFVNAFKNAGPWGQLLTAAFLAKKLGAFNAAGNAAGGLFLKTLKKSLGGPLAGALRRSGETAAASAAEGLADHLPASVDARRGRINKAFRGSGRIWGTAAGAAAALAVGFELTRLLKPQLDALAQQAANLITGTSPAKNAAQRHKIASEEHQRAIRESARTGLASPWIDSRGRQHFVPGKLKTLRIPDARPLTPHRRTQQHTPVPPRPDQRFASRQVTENSTVNHINMPVNITTPAGEVPDAMTLGVQLARVVESRFGGDVRQEV